MTPQKRLALLLKNRPELIERFEFIAAEPAVKRVGASADAFATVRPLLDGRDTEALVCVALDRRQGVIEAAILTTGNDGFTVVDPAQVYRWALTRKRKAFAIILAHNHPSGDPTPSVQDCDITRRVAQAGHVLGVALLDHIVVGGARYSSLADLGELATWPAEPVWTT